MIQAGKQVLFDLVEFKQGRLVRAAQGVAFAFDQEEDFLAERQVFAEVASDGFGRGYCAATGAAAGRLVALPWNF